MRTTNHHGKRRWLLPIVALGSVSALLFTSAYQLDRVLIGRSGSALDDYLVLDPGMLTDAISQLAPNVVALLGIVVTVVAIIVQLAANRFSGVARRFLNDGINQRVMAFYVVAAVMGVWLSVALHEDFTPRIALVLCMLLASFGTLLMLPYFAYVFWFLEPPNLIRRIREQASDAVGAACHASSSEAIADCQKQALDALAELTDISNHSIAAKDKIVASRAVDALRDFASSYLDRKGELPGRWFAIGALIRENPDFVAMDPESLADLEQRHTWLEWQVLRQYLSIYAESLGVMRDINYLIAIDTRYLGEQAAKRLDRELVALVFRFFNSYMRATLNARDVRTAYNVLNQYRLFGQNLLHMGHGAHALEALRHMSYYGHVSFDLTLNFVTETVAYDISSLCQTAHEASAIEVDDMLFHFLRLDRPLRIKSQERALLGVRKAQVKLAAYFISAGDHRRARLIAEDMREERGERLAIIRGELESVVEKDFWEIIDRGRSFEYMPPPQRAALPAFFDLLAEVQAAGE
ncbi:MAG: DUF2254 domain-containing protein [Xanthomonadales bacterium]|nr:DUF2254 domain-containing protein [Xanthomonadales bacterium]